MLTDRLPRGFRQSSSATGLLIPEDTPRAREVWTKDEVRLHDRFMALLADPRRQLKLMLQCGNPECASPQLERIKVPGGYLLRCGCKDRHFQRAF